MGLRARHAPVQRDVAMNTIVKIDCDLVAASMSGSIGFFEQLALDPNDVVLDLRSVVNLDGSGLGALLQVFKRKRAHGATLSLVNVSGQPR